MAEPLTLGDLLPPEIQMRDPGNVDISCLGDPARGALLELLAVYAVSYAKILAGLHSLIEEYRESGKFGLEAAEGFLTLQAEGILPILDRTQCFVRGGEARQKAN